MIQRRQCLFLSTSHCKNSSGIKVSKKSRHDFQFVLPIVKSILIEGTDVQIHSSFHVLFALQISLDVHSQYSTCR